MIMSDGTMGSGSLLKMTYIGHTTFRLETENVSLLINPGIWDGVPVVPADYDVRVIVATNHAEDACHRDCSKSEIMDSWK